jgi:hypothetical protein
MKKLVLPIAIVLVLLWLVFNKTLNVKFEKEFQSKQDSIQHVVDSLNNTIAKKDSTIGELYKIDMDLNYQVLHQKEKIQTIVKYVQVEKNKIDTYNEHQLISHFNQLYPKDTTTNPLPLAQPVLVSAAKDLVELDGAKQQLVIKDSVIALDEERIATKDATINLFKSKESDYKFIFNMKDEQIKDYKIHYESLKLENKKLKFKNKFTKIGTAVVIGGLTYLLISK